MQREVSVPEVGEGVESVQVAKLLVDVGDSVKIDQPIVEIETGKAIVEVPSTDAGTVAEILLEVGAEVKPGDPILRLEGDQSAPEEKKDAGGEKQEAQDEDRDEKDDQPEKDEGPAPTEEGDAEPRGPATSDLVPAAPSVRRLARELGLDLKDVRGSGPHGRVSKADLEQQARAPQQLPAASAPTLPDFSQWGPVTIEKMTGIRRQTAAHLAVCWSQIPHVTIHDRADITALEPLRKKFADRADKDGGKLTMAVMVTKIVAAALRRFPRMNASIDMDAGTVVLKEYCHVGIAVATERGLVVPVIRDADRKNMVELAVEISAVAARARKGRLAVDEMRGGTFTVTNLGRIGGEYFTPIINHPEVGILGMGRYVQEREPDGGGARTMLPLSLSFDHRLIDGADGAAFLGWIVEAIREPLLLSLEG